MLGMKKGFTLVELLIVVVILVTLMSMVFRLGAIGGASEKRAITIQRMQRLENALSGYYAAFGMYPPVAVHGSRNIFLAVDDSGQQSDDGTENDGWGDKNRMWQQVNNACRSQPIACEFPFASNNGVDPAKNASDELPSEAGVSFDDGVTQNIGRHARNKDETSWSKIKLFKFGVLSYLLPRYLFMMNGDPRFFQEYAQWTGNNTEPRDSMTGREMNWQKVQDYVNSSNARDMIRVANIPSQAVCARWMASFEGALTSSTPHTFFGVNVVGESNGSPFPWWDYDNECLWGREKIYYPGGYGGGTSGGYVLDSITMQDGWNNDFYYYSPSPHQSYTVWSAGANGRTFAPWISRKELGAQANEVISEWIEDDIVSQSN